MDIDFDALEVEAWDLANDTPIDSIKELLIGQRCDKEWIAKLTSERAEVTDYLNRYCDNECDGVNCDDDQRFDARSGEEDVCLCDAIRCCRECLVGFAKEALSGD